MLDKSMYLMALNVYYCKSKPFIMRKSFSALAILSIAVIFFLSFSYTDNPLNQTQSIDVNGKVMDHYGNGIAGVSAIIGNQITSTVYDGSFTIKNVSRPYDLKLLQETGPLKLGFVYEGLTTETPQANFNLEGGKYNSTELSVTLPGLKQDQRVYLAFTDGMYVECIGGWGGSFYDIHVIWPGTDPTINGKVVVLIYNFGENNTSSTYENYGEKDITLRNGINDTIAFAPYDLVLDPGEENISGTIVNPISYTNLNSQLKLSFKSGGNFYPDASSMSSEGGFTFNINVPTGLPSPVRFAIYGFAATENYKIYTNNGLEVFPGTLENVLQIPEPILLETPENNASMIDTTSDFTFSASSEGVNAVLFATKNIMLYVITQSTNIRIPNFSYYGLDLPADDYTWFVQKHIGLRTTDEFVSTALWNNNNWTGLGRSETRMFKMKP